MDQEEPAVAASVLCNPSETLLILLLLFPFIITFFLMLHLFSLKRRLLDLMHFANKQKVLHYSNLKEKKTIHLMPGPVQ